MSWRDEAGVLHKGRRPGSANKQLSVEPGMFFGNWEVLERKGSDKRREPVFLCRCVCGTTKPLTSYNLRKRSGSCGCGLLAGNSHPQWGGHGEISGNYWDQIKRGATREKGRTYTLDFTISIAYAWKLFVKQGRRCALTGLPLTMSRRRTEHTASLDRIDSREGYVPGNVQWVHKEVNMMKRTLPQNRFVELCRLVTSHHSG